MVDDDTRAESIEHAATQAGPSTGPEVGHVAIARYSGTALLGRGGMGEVTKVTDVEIGREIAIKRMRDPQASPELVERFLREAKIQARLEHPAIVPVYELGTDQAGRPYFTMKRIGGTTLAQLLAGAGDTRRCLRALHDVARAIDFAHRRGIVHRDLKPANIMLGEFGEVHVLDWGVARVLVENAPTTHSIQPSEALQASEIDSVTRHGDIVGTPGYMAPEQARGEPVDRAADVYALGAVLFEIVAGVPLHPRGQAALDSTLTGVTTGPRERRPDREVAPELDALCLRAVATDPARRPSARAFADDLQRYLDGDRDQERRRGLALEHLAAARAAWERRETNDLEARSLALREAGRALSLDPELVAAADLVEELRSRPTVQQPPEVERVIATVDRASAKQQASMAGIALLSGFLPFSILALFVGVQSWTDYVVFQIAWVLWVANAFVDARTGSPVSAWCSVITGAIVAGVATRVFGPFIVVPSVAAAGAVTLVAYPPLRGRPALVVGLTLMGFVVPLVLEAAGVLSPSFTITDGKIVSYSILALEGWSGAAFVIGATLFMIVATAGFMHRVAMERRDAQVSLAIQAWHDRQLSPAK
jgi:serine/threonine-protein kinase